MLDERYIVLQVAATPCNENQNPKFTLMKALSYHGNRDLRFEEIEQPEPAEGELRVAITDAGLSQATVAEFIEGPFIINNEAHPRTGIALPLVMCQEFGGFVDKVGPGVDKDLVGVTGAVLPSLPCGTCDNCKAGKDNLCSTLAYRGLVGAHGGFTEYVAIPREDFFATTPNVQPNMVEPLLVTLHAINQLKANGGLDASHGQILILGAGSIGICLAGILRDVYQLESVLSDPLENRMKQAAQLGFDVIATEKLASMENAFSIVVDAAGKDLSLERQPLDLAIEYCAAGGRILGIGTYFITLDLLPARFLFQEITLLPSFAYTRAEVNELAKIQSSLQLDFSSMVTKVPFEAILDEGFYLAELDRNAFTRITTAPFTGQARKAAA